MPQLVTDDFLETPRPASRVSPSPLEDELLSGFRFRGLEAPPFDENGEDFGWMAN
jgi:hypothetical protein